MIEPFPPLRPSSPFLSYGIAVLSVAIALTIKLFLSTLIEIEQESPFLLFFAAVIVSSVHGGKKAGITAILLAALASDYLFLPPRLAFTTNLGQNLRLLLFVLESYFISSVISRLQITQHQLKAEQNALKQSEAALQRSYLDLEDRVKERTLQVEQSNQALQQEIQERQQIAEALRGSERRFRAIFNQTFQFIGLMRPDGTLLEANQTALDFGGIQRSDVVGRPLWEAYWWTISPQTQQQLQAAIAQAASGEFVRYEVDVLGSGNQIATVDFSIQPIRDDSGQVVLLIPEGRNITALKQAEQTLRSFFDSASMMMGIVELVGDEDIRHLTENAAVSRFFGGDLSQQPSLASQRGVPEVHIQKWIRHYRESERTRQPVRFEYWHEAPTGQRYCLSATVCSILGTSEAARFAYIVEDISDRKQAELQICELNEALEQRVAERTAQLEAANHHLAREIVEREQTLQILQQAEESLRQSEERFRIALQNSPIVVFNQDLNLRYTWIHNSKLGYGAESMLGKTDFDLIMADNAQELNQIKHQVIASGQGQRHEVQVVSEYGVGYFDLTVEPLRDEAGKTIGITAAAIDITDRKQIEAELQNRAQQQAAIAHLGQQALSSHCLDDLINDTAHLITQTLNLEYCLILEDMPAQNAFYLRGESGLPLELSEPIIIPAQVAQAPEEATALQTPRFTGAKFLEDYSVVSSLEVAIAGPDHPFGILSVHSTQPRTFSRDDVYFLQAAANILAETIQRQRDQETLKQQAQELEQANRLKDEFLATLSHELRTPLNAMLGWSRLLPSGNLDPAVSKQAISAISRNTQSLAQIVEDVLDMSDIITGKLTLQVAPVDLALVIDQAIAAILLAAQAKQISIQSKLDTLPSQVLGDAARLQQVVWNLLSNAVKFTPPEGRVEISLTQVEDSEVISRPRYAQITVTDNGKGISPDFLPFVFDRFRQEDSSLMRSYGGLGLGLAIARYLIELHGGVIQVESLGLDCGATFIVRLPLAIDPQN
ncbi:MAG TPA: PAS domain S-box protein [Trichocoleus sp.]